ncbi:MAG TPA: crotonase/enoyl-CoA hydratase family protein [Stellaceae bacterium]|nr:crotonase/enoyl-CoA hydratase family protein [Stellaceae bacterium]
MDETGPKIETRGAVLVIALDRPARRNAVDHATALAIEAAIDRFEADDSLRVAVITGSGGIFSAGSDLKASAAGSPPARTPRRGWYGMIEGRPEKPVIAAVEGFALGGGCELVLACDLVVAARDARFGLPEVRRSLAPAAGGMLRLPSRLPANIAMEMALTGDPLPAERLYQLGLVNRLCEPGTALETAVELAERIAENPALALRTVKRMVRRSLDMAEAGGWADQAEALAALRASEDYREGIQAFAEGRKPVWRNR